MATPTSSIHTHWDYAGYPVPKDHTSPYVAKKEPSNPALRGIALQLASLLLPKIPGIPNLFYKNAGWPSITKLSTIGDVDARYEPLVVPTGARTTTDFDAPYTDVSVARQRHGGRGGVATTQFYSVLDFHDAYKSGRTTPSAVVEALLPLIQRTGTQPSKYARAWVDVNVELVRAAAQASTERWRAGKALGVLDGVPVGVKDEMDVRGYYKKNLGTVSNYTNALDQTSWCVAMWEKEGAVLLGKLNMHEAGMDTCNNNLTYGVPLNAYNESYYPGGSSGGSSSAVSSGIVPIALGCDGGGSIRLPSSWCGIYGLKTSHGRISTRPYVTRATSTSVAGPMAANMVDLEVAYRVMSQPDPEDNINSRFPLPLPSKAASTTKKLGVYRIWSDRADAPVKAAFQKTVDYFVKELGYELVDITIPHVHEGQMAHAMTILNEATSTMTETELSSLAAPNQLLITVGRNANVTEFLCAQRIRNLIMQHLAFIFERHPGILLLTPTTPNPGWPIHPGDSKVGVSDGNRSIRNMEYVWLANFTGLPSITCPVGYTDPIQGSGVVPIGLMATAEWGAENDLIDFGYEAETYLHTKVAGGRLKPGAWVDALATEAQVDATSQSATTTVEANNSSNGSSTGPTAKLVEPEPVPANKHNLVPQPVEGAAT